MKTKLLTLIGLTVALAAAAAEQVLKITDPEAPAPKWAFGSKEWNVESYYTARFSGDFDNAQQGIGVGVGYALTPNIVVSVRGVSYLDDPNGINEILGRVTYRAELPLLGPKIAPYGFTEGGGNLQSGEGFAGAGGGIEWRPIKHVGVFAESDLRLNTEWIASVGILFGLRLSL